MALAPRVVHQFRHHRRKSVTMASAAAARLARTMAGVFAVHTYTCLPAACAAAVAAADAAAWCMPITC